MGTEAGLKPEKARVEALIQQLAQKLDLPTEVVAQGIIDVVDEHMIHALSKVSIQQGFDPKDFALVLCGAGLSSRVCALAEKLGIKTIIVPSCPGVFSALGLVLRPPL